MSSATAVSGTSISRQKVMPIYEFRCSDCHRTTSIFVRSVTRAVDPRCEHCGSARLRRAVSRFAHHRTEADVLRDFGDEPRRLEDYRDPRQIGRWAERRFQEYGIEMPEEARKMIDAAREGEFPEPVKDL